MLPWKERKPLIELTEYKDTLPNRADVIRNPEWAFECVVDIREQLRILHYELAKNIEAALTNKYTHVNHISHHPT